MLIMMINLLGKRPYIKTSFLIYLIYSSTAAEIYVQAHERTAISTALHPPQL